MRGAQGPLHVAVPPYWVWCWGVKQGSRQSCAAGWAGLRPAAGCWLPGKLCPGLDLSC